MLRKNRQLLVILSIFIVFLWANGHQKGASLPLLGAECTSGMLNGDAPEYAYVQLSNKVAGKGEDVFKANPDEEYDCKI